jgi:hypothetical protein
MTFNDALSRAAEIALRHLADPTQAVVLVRDLYGKFRVALPDDHTDVSDALGSEFALPSVGYY